MKRLMQANIRRAATCRGPWPRTQCFAATFRKHSITSSAARVYDDKSKTRVTRAGQVDISFVINYSAEHGQHVVLLGSCQELGSWDTAAAVRLTRQQGDNWKGSVQLLAPADRNLEVEYKYAIISADGSVELWQEGPNISLLLRPEPTANSQPEQLNLKVFDSWLQPQQSQHVLAVHVMQLQVQSSLEHEPVLTVKQQQQQQAQQLRHQVQAQEPLQRRQAKTQVQQLQAQTQRQHQRVVLNSNDSSCSCSKTHSSIASNPDGKRNSCASPGSSSSSSSSSSLSHIGADDKTAAASWAGAAGLLAKVAAAASSAAVVAGSSLAAAASEAAAIAATSYTAGLQPASSSTRSGSTAGAEAGSAAATAGYAVAQVLTAVAAGVITFKDAAANSIQANATSSSSSSSSSSSETPGAAAASCDRQTAISQATTAVANGWRSLLAAAAIAQHRAKSAAGSTSSHAYGNAIAPAAFAAVTVAGGTSTSATWAASNTAAAAAPTLAAATEDAVQNTKQGKFAAVADQTGTVADDKQQQSQQVLVKGLPASAQQLPEQQVLANAPTTDQQQQTTLGNTLTVNVQQQKPLQVLAEAEAALATDDQQKQAVAAVATDLKHSDLLTSAFTPGKQQQHRVSRNALNASQLLQQQMELRQAVIGPSTAAAGHHNHQQRQQHLLAAAVLSKDQHDQQQVLAQVLNALERSARLRQESGDPCDPSLLAADRRLAAATDVFRSFAHSSKPGGLQQQQEVLQEVHA